MTELLLTLVADGEVKVPDATLTPVPLRLTSSSPPWLGVGPEAIRFRSRRWCEALLTVAWDPANGTGTRFSHISIPDRHPLHSEAIDAAVLAQVSDGRQLLRGNTVFDPGGPDQIRVEVWQDSGEVVRLLGCKLEIRCLSHL